MSLENIKQEPELRLNEAAVRTELYEKHEIKNELVLGPVVLQLPDVAYSFKDLHTGHVKIEKDSTATNTTGLIATEMGQKAKKLAAKDKSSAKAIKLGLTPLKKRPTTVVPGLTTKDMGCTATELHMKSEPEWEDKWAVTLRDQKMKQELLNSLELRAADSAKELHLMKLESIKSRDTGRTEDLQDKDLLKKGLEFTNPDLNSPKITKSERILGSRFRIRFEADSDTEEEIKKRKTRPKKIHKCDYCGKQFRFRSTLTNHVRIHTGEKPHKCHICYKKFSDYAVLCRHRKVHTGEKPHICDICGNKYSEKYLLNNHKLIHTGEMKYFCKDCPKTFVNSSNFRRHQLVHKHKYTCDICQRKFPKKPLLASHIINHMKPNSKVYKCDFCDKTFGMMGHLNRHLAIHMGPKEVYTCGVCMKDFTQHSSLKRHVIKRVCIKNKSTIKSLNSKERKS